MANKLRIVLAQLNFKVGDLEGNLEKHLNAANKARDEFAADIIVFPELSLIGYPCEDLLLRSSFLQEAEQTLQKFVQQLNGIYCLVGHPHVSGKKVYNAISLVRDGKIICRYEKQKLPNYGVFDESRYFTAGQNTCVTHLNEVPIGLAICEDIWHQEPLAKLAAAGAKLILVPNASPFEINKHEQRMSLLTKRATTHNVSIVYTNLIGGQDELVFDGGSMVMNNEGKLIHHAGFFNEHLLPVEMDFSATQTVNTIPPISIPSIEARTYQALVLAVRDYIHKNRIPSVLVGASGGIDSALTLTIACDALGAERVRAILMPSRYTADMSNEDALLLAKNLGVQTETFSIEPVYQQFLTLLAPVFKDKQPDITEENIQARCRAIILMALSNQTGALVLTTGNRSELAVGYCTLYGDMAGGFAVLKDIPKTFVYELARYRNQLSEVIPARSLIRPPTAELSENQKDEDSLPPYAMLDQIIEAYMNQGLSNEDIIAKGFAAPIVKKVIKLIHGSEYKRKQSAIGPHVNHQSFGKDWRYPVVNGYKK